MVPSPVRELIIINGNFQFTEAGVEAMKTSRQVSFDFTALPLDMADVGLGEDSDGAMVDIFVNYPDAQNANPEIQRAANELGILPLKNATNIGPEFKDGTGKETWNPGYGNATGTVFALSIMSNHTTGRMTFIYTVFLSDEYYTPEATARSQQPAGTGPKPAGRRWTSGSSLPTWTSAAQHPAMM